MSYDATDPSLNHVQSGSAPPHNKAGLFGAYAAGFLDDIFGLGALIWPVIFAVLGAVHLSSRLTLRWWRWTGFFLLTLCFMTIASAFDLHIGDLAGGGIIGNTLQIYSTRYLSPFGSTLLWLFVGLVGVQMAANFSWISLGQRIQLFTRSQALRFKKEKSAPVVKSAAPQKPSGMTNAWFGKIASLSRHLTPAFLARFTKLKTYLTSKRDAKEIANPFPASQRADSFERWDDDPFAITQDLRPDSRFSPLSDDAQNSQEKPGIAADNAARPASCPNAPVPDMTPAAQDPSPQELLPWPEETTKPEPKPDFAPEPAHQPEHREETAQTAPILAAPPIQPQLEPLRLFQEKKEFEFPSTALLDAGQPHRPASPEDLKAKGNALMQCFQDFDIQGELARITPGPVVTMFEVRPAAGIRVSKIANLSDDLGLAMKAVAVRIQAPIPGSDTVGIEIPNDHRETVNFRELAESKDFAAGAGPLTMILGKNIAGHPFMADLTKMPHMLVAGATGAGKSVCLNSILISLLYKHDPNHLKLLLVDPKRIEMAVYADLPHLVHPVVTEMDDAKNALAWAVQEMENRFKTFMRLGVRNIAAYHDKLKSFAGNTPANLADLEPLPYMVIVIDELADLMLTAARDVEPKIQRLAQLARAAGIHMILATQRPSVDVVTGLIKAQFPCRISFQVSSKHDSRTILDQVGAEHLLGRGDMLFKPAGGRLQRLHGPFVSDEEVQAVASHWKKQQTPKYEVDFSQWGAETAPTASQGAGSDATSDPLYNEARNFVLDQGRASISLLQRHLKIGFNRAARLMEQFERDGLIGPADGSKPREVLR